MTIDSSWLHAFKEEAPHAFTQTHPFAPRAIFVDGQIKLMQAFQSTPQTWDEFIHRQFTRHLERCFQTCDVVILAFDNYDKVPRAKCMTQTQRRRNIPVLPFSEHSELPCMVPEGERWTQCIANRVFKTRVIDLVLLRLPQVLLKPGEPNARKRLIVDYHQPREYWFDQETRRVEQTAIDELPSMGEADVKFTRYASRYGRLMVDSIDGDSIPIALMHLERELRSTTPQRIPEVSVYRLELHAPGGARNCGGKRGAEGEAKKAKAKRTYEFVNINALYIALKQAVAQCVGRITMPTHQGHEMAMLVGLIALTGTDFTRNLPQMSGKTVFSFLPDIWTTLTMVYDPERGAMQVEEATELLVGRLYGIKFPKHVTNGTGGDLAGTLAELQRAKLGARVKESLPTVARVACTVRNANWLLAYWTCVPSAPDPIQAAYGFRTCANGATEYDD